MSTEQDLEALFRAERAVSPAADAPSRGWQRLSADLAANVAPLPVSSGALKLSAWLVPKWLLVGFGLGLAGVGASVPLFGESAPSSAQAPRVPSAPLIASAEPRQVATSETDTVRPIPPVPSASAQRSVERAPRAAPVASEAASAATFDAELELITLAKRELDAHHPRQAQASLAAHARQFPNGVFAVEREALGILSSCEQGPKDEAASGDFAKRYPGSPLIQRIQRACGPSADFRN